MAGEMAEGLFGRSMFVCVNRLNVGERVGTIWRRALELYWSGLGRECYLTLGQNGFVLEGL